jgi:hypothetical protein
MISLGDMGGKRKPSRLTPVSPIWFHDIILKKFNEFLCLFQSSL